MCILQTADKPLQEKKSSKSNLEPNLSPHSHLSFNTDQSLWSNLTQQLLMGSAKQNFDTKGFNEELSLGHL